MEYIASIRQSPSNKGIYLISLFKFKGKREKKEFSWKKLFLDVDIASDDAEKYEKIFTENSLGIFSSEVTKL